MPPRPVSSRPASARRHFWPPPESARPRQRTRPYSRRPPVCAGAFGHHGPAEDYGYRPQASNPRRDVRRYRRQGQKRFCSVEEVRRLGLVLKQHEPRSPTETAIVRLPLLTGCRGQEIVSLRWTEHREGQLHLHLSDSKTGSRMVWLSSPARRISGGLPRDSPRVFASTRTRGHISSSTVGKLWTSIRVEAGLSDVRLRDLHQTFASHAVTQGTPLPIVSHLLGHTRPTMTCSAHMGDRETEAAAERLGSAIAGMLDIG